MSATVDVVIPVFNEEKALPRSMVILADFLKDNLRNPWQIIIADNGSTDGTKAVAEMLCERYAGINYLYIPQKGRGRALKAAWLDSNADIVSYMDVDLATDLTHFPQLVGSLQEGYHLAIGNRLGRESRASRSLKRGAISRGYNMLIKSMFFTPFQDAQCGFKALTRRTAQAIVPRVKNDGWFFDTEMLIIAAKRGYRIMEIPVKWDDDPTSTVNVASAAAEDIKGLLRLRFGGIPQVEPPGNHLPQE